MANKKDQLQGGISAIFGEGQVPVPPPISDDEYAEMEDSLKEFVETNGTPPVWTTFLHDGQEKERGRAWAGHKEWHQDMHAPW